jgi:transposase
MRALEPEVFDTVFAAIEPLLPVHAETHPLGCHRPRVPDRDCFEVMLVHLVTGSSWEDCERLCGNKVSDTTVRARRDEWEEAGVFDAVAQEAIAAYDKIIGLDLSEVAVDGSLQKSPAGGEGTGKNSTDRAKLGWKWSILTDAKGIPIGWTIDGANRKRLADLGIHDAVIAKKRKRGSPAPAKKLPMGLRWPVERTNSWLSNFGALRRNTDRKTKHRLAQFALATTFLLAAKLIDWRNRRSTSAGPSAPPRAAHPANRSTSPE